MRVAFGGSFNPPTIAHRKIIEILSKKYDEVIIVPNGSSYERKKLDNFFDRVQMLKIMTNDLSNVVISEIEHSRNFLGTFQTLRELKHPYFVCGDDCLLDFKTWIQADLLLSENKFIILTRNKTVEDIKTIIKNDDFLSKFENQFEILVINYPDVSSSIFRTNFDKNIVTEEVYEYITKNNIYKEDL